MAGLYDEIVARSGGVSNEDFANVMAKYGPTKEQIEYMDDIAYQPGWLESAYGNFAGGVQTGIGSMLEGLGVMAKGSDAAAGKESKAAQNIANAVADFSMNNGEWLSKLARKNAQRYGSAGQAWDNMGVYDSATKTDYIFNPRGMLADITNAAGTSTPSIAATAALSALPVIGPAMAAASRTAGLAGRAGAAMVGAKALKAAKPFLANKPLTSKALQGTLNVAKDVAESVGAGSMGYGAVGTLSESFQDPAENIENFIKMGKELGLEGHDLDKFVRDKYIEQGTGELLPTFLSDSVTGGLFGMHGAKALGTGSKSMLRRGAANAAGLGLNALGEGMQEVSAAAIGDQVLGKNHGDWWNPATWQGEGYNYDPNFRAGFFGGFMGLPNAAYNTIKGVPQQNVADTQPTEETPAEGETAPQGENAPQNGTVNEGTDVRGRTGADIAQMVQKYLKRPLPLNWIYAQMYHETAGFDSELAHDHHNYSGMKVYDAENEQAVEGGTPEGDGTSYRHFNSDEEYAKAYANLLNQYEEEGVFDANSLEEFARALKRGGWYDDLIKGNDEEEIQNYIKGMTDALDGSPATISGRSSYNPVKDWEPGDNPYAEDFNNIVQNGTPNTAEEYLKLISDIGTAEDKAKAEKALEKNDKANMEDAAKELGYGQTNEMPMDKIMMQAAETGKVTFGSPQAAQAFARTELGKEFKQTGDVTFEAPQNFKDREDVKALLADLKKNNANRPKMNPRFYREWLARQQETPAEQTTPQEQPTEQPQEQDTNPIVDETVPPPDDMDAPVEETPTEETPTEQPTPQETQPTPQPNPQPTPQPTPADQPTEDVFKGWDTPRIARAGQAMLNVGVKGNLLGKLSPDLLADALNSGNSAKVLKAANTIVGKLKKAGVDIRPFLANETDGQSPMQTEAEQAVGQILDKFKQSINTIAVKARNGEVTIAEAQQEMGAERGNYNKQIAHYLGDATQAGKINKREGMVIANDARGEMDNYIQQTLRDVSDYISQQTPIGEPIESEPAPTETEPTQETPTEPTEETPSEPVETPTEPTQETPAEPTETTEPTQGNPVEPTEETPNEPTQPTETPAVGKEVEVSTDDGKKVKVKYKVKEASTLITSNNADTFAENPNYPQELQPRDRERVGMKIQITNMASNIKAEELTDSRNLNQGAPITRSDGVVLNGNGRTMAITRAYNLAKADAYKAYLIEHAEDFGLDVEQIKDMKNPVLVREIDEVDDATIRSIIGSVTGGSRMAASEQAKADAEKISIADLQEYVPNEKNDMTTAGNRAFIAKILGKLVADSDRNAYYDKDGKVNADGIQRVKRALFAAAYADENLISKMAESADDDTKNLTNGLMGASPKVAELNKTIQEGHAHDIGLLDAINNAIQRYGDLKANGKPIEAYLNEVDMFGEYEDSPEVKAIVTAFNDFRRSGVKTGRFINRLAEINIAQGDPNQQSMFGGNVMPLMDVIKMAKENAQDGTNGTNIFDIPGQPTEPRDVQPNVGERQPSTGDRQGPKDNRPLSEDRGDNNPTPIKTDEEKAEDLRKKRQDEIVHEDEHIQLQILTVRQSAKNKDWIYVIGDLKSGEIKFVKIDDLDTGASAELDTLIKEWAKVANEAAEANANAIKDAAKLTKEGKEVVKKMLTFFEKNGFNNFSEKDRKAMAYFLAYRAENMARIVNALTKQKKTALDYLDSFQFAVKAKAGQLGSWHKDINVRYNPKTGRNERISIGSQNARELTIPNTANLTDLQHELGHMFLEDLHRLTLLPNCPDVLVKDFKAITKWMGWRGNPWQTQVHKKFNRNAPKGEEPWAQAWAKYLHEGKTTIPALDKLFGLVKGAIKWFMQLYQNEVNTFAPVQREAYTFEFDIPAEIKQAMDRCMYLSNAYLEGITPLATAYNMTPNSFFPTIDYTRDRAHNSNGDWLKFKTTKGAKQDAKAGNMDDTGDNQGAVLDSGSRAESDSRETVRIVEEKADGKQVKVAEEKAPKKVMGLAYDDLDNKTRKAIDNYLENHPDGKRIKANLLSHKGTPWEKQAIDGIKIRINLESLLKNGTLAIEDSALTHLYKGNPHPIVDLIQKRGMEGAWDFIKNYHFIGAPGKPLNSIMSSFVNCNPTAKCAQYCYAAKAKNYMYRNAVVKGEIIELLINDDPAMAAEIAADQFERLGIGYEENLALRLLDKGDLSEKWVDFVDELNKRGIRTQIFSKRPEFLKNISKTMNVIMLSVDAESANLAKKYPNLPIAFVYDGTGNALDKIKTMEDRYRKYGGVILPIVQGQKYLSKEQIAALPEWAQDYVCPIDSGEKHEGTNVKLNPPNTNDPNSEVWSCVHCDKFGNAGCFFGRSLAEMREFVRNNGGLSYVEGENITNTTEPEGQRVLRQLAAAVKAMQRSGVEIPESILGQADAVTKLLLNFNEQRKNTANSSEQPGGMAEQSSSQRGRRDDSIRHDRGGLAGTSGNTTVNTDAKASSNEGAFSMPKYSADADEKAVDEKRNKDDNKEKDFGYPIFNKHLNDGIKKMVREIVSKQISENVNLDDMGDVVKRADARENLPFIRQRLRWLRQKEVKANEAVYNRMACQVDYAWRCFDDDERIRVRYAGQDGGQQGQGRTDKVGDAVTESLTGKSRADGGRSERYVGNGISGELRNIREYVLNLNEALLKEKKSASFNSKDAAENGDLLNYDFIKRDKLSVTEKLIYDAAGQLGINVRFVDAPLAPGSRGVMFAGNSIIVNRKGNVAPRIILFHELTHWLKLHNPEVYKQLRKQVNPTAERIAGYAKAIKNGQELDDETIIEEMIADAVAKSSARHGLLQQMINSNRSLGMKIVGTLLNAWYRIKDAIMTAIGNSPAKALAEGLTPHEIDRITAELNKAICSLKANGKTIFTMRNGQVFNVETGTFASLYSFAGELSQTAALDQLDIAKRMKNSKASAKDIWEQTGWKYSEKDKKWRYEIPDNLNAIKFDTLFKRTNYRANLGAVYKNPALYAAYPWLAKVPVKLADLDEYGHTIKGEADKGSAKGAIIRLKYDEVKNDPLEQKLTLIHEIQHLIQYREGFAEGGTGEEEAQKRGISTDEAYSLVGGEQESTEVEQRARDGITDMPTIHSDDAIVIFDGKEQPAYKQDKTVLLAPNGKPSNLTPKQYRQVRTPAFKKWFGDWENGKVNKALLDDNGEPKVFYHGTVDKPFTKFSKDFIGTRYAYDEIGFFFTDSKAIAEDYAQSEFNSEVYGGVIPAFISSKKPLVADGKWFKEQGMGNVFKDMDSIEVWDTWQSFLLEEAENAKADSIVLDDGNSRMAVAFEPNQIKSATDNNGQFSADNDDIRYSAAADPQANHKSALLDRIKDWALFRAIKALTIKPADNVTVNLGEPKNTPNRLEIMFRSPTRLAESYPQLKYVVDLAEKAALKQEKLRTQFVEAQNMMNEFLANGDFEKNRKMLQNILFMGDSERKAYTDDELRDMGANESVIKGYRQIRNTLEKAWEMVNDVYQKAITETKTVSGAEYREMAAGKVPFIQLRKATKVQGQDKYVVTIRRPKTVVRTEVMNEQELNQLKKDSNVYIADPQNDIKPYRPLTHVQPGELGLVYGDKFYEVTYETANPSIGHIKGYVPHIFHDFFVVQRYLDENGNEVGVRILKSYDNLTDATTSANEYAKEHPDKHFGIVPKQFQFPGEGQQAAVMGDMDYFDVMNRMANTLSITPAEAQRLMNDSLRMKNRGRFLDALMAREDVEGYEKDDIYRALQMYFNQVGRYVALDDFKRKSINHYEQTYGDFNAEKATVEAKAVRNYINDVNGVPTGTEVWLNDVIKSVPVLSKLTKSKAGGRPSVWLANAMTYYMSVAKLGLLNISSALVNTTQLFNLAGALDAGAKGGWHYLKHGMSEYFRASKDERLHDFLMEDLGLRYTMNLADYNSYSKGDIVSKMVNGSGFKDLADKSFFLFRKVDELARATTLLGAYRKALDDGMSKEDAIQYARDIDHQVNFEYNVFDAPDMFRRFGPIGTVLFQFQKYPVKEVELLFKVASRGYERGGWKGMGKDLVRYTGPYFLASGMYGVPFIGIMAGLINGLVRAAGGDDDWDLETELKKWAFSTLGENNPLVKTFFYGVTSNFGLNIGQRVGIGDFGSSLLSSGYQESNAGWVGKMLGATTLGNTFMQAYTNFMNNGMSAETLKAITPYWGGVFQAVNGYSKTSLGRMKYKYDPYDRLLRAAGFAPMNEKMATDLSAIEYSEQKKERSAKQTAIDDFLDAEAAKDTAKRRKAYERFRELGIKPADVKKERDKRNKTKAERDAERNAKLAQKKPTKQKEYSLKDYQ